MKTIKELELDLIVKEALIQQLKYKNEMLREEIASVYEDIIDKAIEYIEYYLAKGKTKNHGQFDISVLDILKGVDKE